MAAEEKIQSNYWTSARVEEIIKNADEQDAYTRWRKWYTYLTRPGAVKKIKKETHRRERREAKQWIKEQLDDKD